MYVLPDTKQAMSESLSNVSVHVCMYVLPDAQQIMCESLSYVCIYCLMHNNSCVKACLMQVCMYMYMYVCMCVFPDTVL